MSTSVASKHELEAWVGFLRSHSAITRQLNVDLLNAHGLTLNDYEVLVHLARADGQMMRRVDLAQSVVLTASGITRLLDGLERCGYVEKAVCASDARVSYAKLTDGGAREARRGHDNAPRRGRRALHEPLLARRARDARRAAVAPADDRQGLRRLARLRLSGAGTPVYWKPRYPTRSMRERAWAKRSLAREQALRRGRNRGTWAPLRDAFRRLLSR